jgi:hypothetical protein
MADKQEPTATDIFAAQIMAKWLHEEYGELAIANGYDFPDAFDTPWELLPDDNPHKQLMVMVCLKFLEGKVSYTVDDDVDGEPATNSIDTTVFQGGTSEIGGRE